MNGRGESPSQSTVDSKEVFIDIIDRLSGTLDDLGLYVVDCKMHFDSSKKYKSLDELRSDAINKKARVTFSVDCFIGKSFWRLGEPNPYLDFLNNLEIGSIEDLLKDYGQDET